VCHVVRDHEENKKSFAGPRFFIRIAELDMHPLDTLKNRKKTAQEEHGLECVTSPSAVLRFALSTSRSPTMRLFL